MISNEELQDLIDNPTMYRGIDIDRLAKEILSLRPCQHHWNAIRLVEGSGRYQYCTLCGKQKIAD